MTRKVELWAQRVDAQTTEDNSQALKSNEVSQVGFQNCLGLVTPFFHFVPVVMGMSVAIILGLTCHCPWEQVTC